MEKALFHSVISMGTKDQMFEVSCRDRTGHDVRRQMVVETNMAPFMPFRVIFVIE